MYQVFNRSFCPWRLQLSNDKDCSVLLFGQSDVQVPLVAYDVTIMHTGGALPKAPLGVWLTFELELLTRLLVADWKCLSSVRVQHSFPGPTGWNRKFPVFYQVVVCFVSSGERQSRVGVSSFVQLSRARS